MTLVQRLEELKRNVRLTVYEDTNHEVVEGAVLGEQKMWDWLLQQKLDTAEPAAQ